MSALETVAITLAVQCGGVALGLFLRERLPDHHVRDDTRDIVKTASAMIATLVALVIGLLVSSSKASFDEANQGITQAGARFIMLDRMLSHYGPETRPIRDRMKTLVQESIARIWPSGKKPGGGLAAIEQGTGMDEVLSHIAQLEPTDEKHRAIRTNAIQLCHDLIQSRWLMIEKSQTAVPALFLVLLIFWLAVLFTSFGLLSPRNATALTCLFVSAVSMAGALGVLIEMNHPFDGWIQASPGPLLKALVLIGQ